MSDKFNDKYRIKSARLEGYDYKNEGLYYVTICTKNRTHYFGECNDGIMFLNDLGKMAEDFWLAIPTHFPNVSLDEFTIMPNHIHGIVCIDTNAHVETLNATSSSENKTLHATSLPDDRYSKISPKQGSLSTVLRSYKSAVSNKAKHFNPNFAWQPRFHDNIIRDAKSFTNIQNYIINNPTIWINDEFYS
ncbi:MAG: transposase [Bacteroidota bacterium]|jgi:REP element-mobilizing transposase RayT